MPENHSAEWLRGRIAGLEEGGINGIYAEQSIAHLYRLLAEAEASEASRVTKERWIEMYGGQAVLDREGMEVVPCVDCTDAVCHGWRVRLKTEASVPTAANGTGTLTLSETIAGLREACAGVTVSMVMEPTEADLAVADELDMLAAHIQEYVGPDDARDDIRRICRNRAEDLRRGVKRGPSATEVIAAAERALELAKGTVECASIDVETGDDLPWYRTANKVLALIAEYKEAHDG